MAGPNLPTNLVANTSTGHVGHSITANGILNKFDTALGTATTGHVLTWNGTVYAPAPAFGAAFFSTGDNSELVSSLSIATTLPTKYVIMSIEVPDLQIGDVVNVGVDMQVTNDHAYNAQFSTQVIAADSVSAVVGTEVTEASGTNVTPDMHHLQVCRTGGLRITDASRRFFNFVGWSAASLAQPGDVLTVDADYGRLHVMRFRGVS